jgi:hypothetical protein
MALSIAVPLAAVGWLGLSFSLYSARRLAHGRDFRGICSAYLDGHSCSVAAKLGVAKSPKHPILGMLSLEEIKNWGDSVAAESPFKLIDFCHNPAKPAGRAVTQVVFGDGGDEYRVWIFREYNIIYVVGFHKGVQADIFRGPLTRRSMHFPDSKAPAPIVIVRQVPAFRERPRMSGRICPSREPSQIMGSLPIEGNALR